MTSRATASSLLQPAPLAWILLDWAASAFSTILITLVVTYVEKIVFADSAWGVAGGVVWAWIIAATMLASAVAAPWLSAWADRTHSHQQALLAAVIVGSGACLALAAVPPEWRLAVAASIVIAGVGFDMGAIFAGSLLPRLAQGGAADRLSAAGFAGGYAGGAIALVLATAVVGSRESLGLSAAGSLRASFAIMGGWWLLFSVPAMVIRMGDGRTAEHEATAGGELLAFARSLVASTDGRPLATVLAGAVLVLGAVQTAISQFSSVAIEEFQMEPPAVVRLVLLVQFVALPGALLVGWLSAHWSRRGALLLCLAGWAFVLVLAWFVHSQTQLYGLAVLLALVLGGVQSVVRATVAGLAPRGSYGATFGLLQVGTKLAGFVASLAFGALYAVSGHPRAGLLALLAQLLAGWWVLRR
jgi:UMF1 family MFS transporter